MAVLTQTHNLATEAVKDKFELNSSQQIGKEANTVNGSLPSPLESFAQETVDNAEVISKFFRNHGLPHPSFARDAPANAFSSTPDDVLAARSKLTEAALRLLQLAQGPQEYIPDLTVNASTFFLQTPPSVTLMVSGTIRCMPTVAHPFLRLPTSTTGRHNLIRCLGEPGKGVCKTTEDCVANGDDFKSLFRARARRGVAHGDFGAAGYKLRISRLGDIHDWHDNTFS